MDVTEPNGRATVELVYRTVDDLGKRMDAHFDAVNIRLNQLDDLPNKVSAIEADIGELKAWKKSREELEEADRYRRMNTRPLIVVGVLGLLVPLILLLGQAHGF